jgi:hypothetical protein
MFFNQPWRISLRNAVGEVSGLLFFHIAFTAPAQRRIYLGATGW